MGTTGSDVEAGFAKLQGEDFEYYMQTYSIILGRNSKKSTVDVDLSSLGGGMNISRHHARIFYDFTRRRFALEVLGKNGCLVEGVLHLPGNAPVKLDSQDLLQIGDKEFYFLLPVRNILGASVGARSYLGHSASAGAGPAVAGAVVPPHSHYNFHLAGSGGGAAAGTTGKKGKGREYYEEGYEDDDDIGGSSGKKFRRDGYGAGGSGGKVGFSGGMVSMDKKLDGRSRVEREADNQLLQEEKDVVSSVATVLSDLCGPGEWMPMEKLHSELVENYGSVWHHSRVRKYLKSEDRHGSEAKDKPWYGLLMLLRKYPEHFVINTRSKGRVTLEFVSLVSLLS
ncbi:FHA domain-containing protein FHA2-like [Cucurbita moschata]|uniref:FHA domain-containing protein FHA2-like n=1 Tax=Cucurbita moschata TaxID=3662 RepID=A0A6J1ESW9_CUCMO|nr:FHA domain-containing protein FHA2-like [Cucurbita moschata]